jgi:hypothetical protein
VPHTFNAGLGRPAGVPIAVAPAADRETVVDPVAHSSLPPEFLVFVLARTKGETKARQIKMKFNRMSKESRSVSESLFWRLEMFTSGFFLKAISASRESRLVIEELTTALAIGSLGSHEWNLRLTR